MRGADLLLHVGWIVHKDLLTEWRTRQIGPAMLLLGGVVGFLFSMQMQAIPHAVSALIGSQYWLTVFLGSVLILDGSFEMEREVQQGSGLRLYPIEPHTIFLAKFLGNFVALSVLQSALVVLFTLLAGIEFGQHPWQLLLVGLTGNLAMASLGTLLAAVACGLQKGRGLLAVLMLPLEIPVVVAAAEATRLLLSGQRWHDLLVVGQIAGRIRFGVHDGRRRVI